jgi:hypothetical protein
MPNYFDSNFLLPHYFDIFRFSHFFNEGKGRSNLGASPQAPGIYRIVNQGRDVKDKTEAANYSLRLFPGYLQALGSLPSVALSSCKTVDN